MYGWHRKDCDQNITNANHIKQYCTFQMYLVVTLIQSKDLKVIFLCEADSYTSMDREHTKSQQYSERERGQEREKGERQITDAVLSIRMPIICNVYLMFDFLLSQGQIASRDTSNI